MLKKNTLKNQRAPDLAAFRPAPRATNPSKAWGGGQDREQRAVSEGGVSGAVVEELCQDSAGTAGEPSGGEGFVFFFVCEKNVFFFV